MGYIFISYSNKDVVYAEKLVNALKREGFNPWVDKEGLQAGTPWRYQLSKQVNNCDAYLLIVSRNSKKSKWVHEELELALSRNKPIFPLRIDNTKPFFGIQAIQYENIRGGRLPSESFYQELAKVTQRRKKTRQQKANSADQAKKHWIEGSAELLSYYGDELAIKGKDFMAKAGKRLSDLKDAIENSEMVKNLPANVKKNTAPQQKKKAVKKVSSSAKKTASKKKKKTVKKVSPSAKKTTLTRKNKQ